MGSKRLDKIGDYVRHGFDLQVACKCGHKATIDARALDDKLFAQRRNSTMILIAPHLKCSKCGRRDVTYGPTWGQSERINSSGELGPAGSETRQHPDR
jgi:hypothetical protein